jgi:hypothetical protein
MPPYQYHPLPPGSIRLLRLMPHGGNATAPIHCQLLEYSLCEPDQTTHLYEALSYVWGDTRKKVTIHVDEVDFKATTNLHAALLRLRNRCLERTIWIDAICINQKDDEEKGHQIQSMPRIFGQAYRVLVWLGEAEDESDQVFEDLRVAAAEESTRPLENQRSVIRLLERPWFTRIWVCQYGSVASA